MQAWDDEKGKNLACCESARLHLDAHIQLLHSFFVQSSVGERVRKWVKAWVEQNGNDENCIQSTFFMMTLFLTTKFVATCMQSLMYSNLTIKLLLLPKKQFMIPTLSILRQCNLQSSLVAVSKSLQIFTIFHSHTRSNVVSWGRCRRSIMLHCLAAPYQSKPLLDIRHIQTHTLCSRVMT